MSKQVLSSLFALALLSASFLPASAAPAAPGSLDTTFAGFSDDGVLFVDDLPGHDFVLQPDGKIVTLVFSGPSSAAVLRYLQNGELDDTFGTGGRFDIPVPVGINSIHPKDVAVQPDGKIVIAAQNHYSDYSGANDFLLIRLTAEGQLDTGFGNLGYALHDFAGDMNIPASVLVQPDGKIVAAGFVTSFDQQDLAVIRLNADGTPDDNSDGDGGFGTNGWALIDFNDVEYATDIILQPDGKLVVVGGTRASGDYDFAVARLEPNGRLDDNANGDGGFSGDGKLTTGFGVDEDAVAVALQPDGAIVVAGRATDLYTYSITQSFVARYTAGGSLDGTFGSGGKVTIPVDMISDLALQHDGKVLLVGYHTSPDLDEKFALRRLTAAGTPDSSFDNGDGVAWLEFGNDDYGEEIAVLPDGRILAMGTSGNRSVLVRLWPDGLTYDTGGQQAHGLAFPPGYRPGYRESVTGLALQPDGALVVAGQAYAPDYAFSQAFVTRFTPQGLLDGSFGTHGSARFGAGIFNAATALALQPDGKIVVAGYAAFSADHAIKDLVVARFHPDGTRDDGFGYSGSYITDFAGGADGASAVAVAPDGKIVAGGVVWNGTAYDWGVLRLTEAGQPDSSFDGDGRFFFGFGIQNGLNALAVQPDGKLLAAGHAGRDFAVARLTEAGQLDPSFGEGGFAFDDLGGTDVITALALAPDGWLYAAGFRIQGGDADLALAQYTPAGELASCPDPADCHNWPTGTFFVDQGINDYAYALDLRGDGQLVAAGCINQHFAGVQVPTDGEPAPLPFNTDLLGYPDCARGVAFAGVDKVVMAGNQNPYPFSSDDNMALARFQTTVDTSVPPAPSAYPVFLPLVYR